MSKFITNVGHDEYHSSDPGDGGRSVVVMPGKTLEVSDAKAEQLQFDHPEWFDVSDTGPEPEESEVAPNTDEPVEVDVPEVDVPEIEPEIEPEPKPEPKGKSKS